VAEDLQPNREKVRRFEPTVGLAQGNGNHRADCTHFRIPEPKAEIDIVALGLKGDVFLGECKWGSVGRDDVDKLMARVDRIVPQLPGVRSVQLGLFSGGAIDTAVQSRIDSGEILLFTQSDLFPT